MAKITISITAETTAQAAACAAVPTLLERMLQAQTDRAECVAHARLAAQIAHTAGIDKAAAEAGALIDWRATLGRENNTSWCAHGQAFRGAWAKLEK